MSSSLGRRRRRILGEDERHLWQKVAESVTPLDREHRRRAAAAAKAAAEATMPDTVTAPVAAPPPPPPAPKPPRRATTAAERADGPPPPPPSKRALAGWAKALHRRLHGPDPEKALVPQPPSLAPMDDRTKRRLVRGTMAIDERLDLHGLTQEAAHAALRRFLIAARDRGARIVLVITGKGKASGSALQAHERGVLRRSVPHWLGDPSLRGVVVGYEEAHLAHGGAGAIYVRLRRIRDHGGDDR